MPNFTVDQAQRLAIFTGNVPPAKSDMFFLVMGETGSGKSTFISRCTGKDVAVSDSLKSHTASLGIYDYEVDGRRIYLIDTPGFNDTNRSDSETLEAMATYLGASYSHKVKIHGIIVLHSINDIRMAGSDIRNIKIFKDICGFDGINSYANLIIATTMWPASPPENEKINLNKREEQLRSIEKYFGWFTKRGATMTRHNENGYRDNIAEAQSAQRIVEQLIEKAKERLPEPLLLQRELIDDMKSLADTTAGSGIDAELYKIRKEHERQLQDLREQLNQQLARENGKHANDLRESKEEAESKFQRAIDDKMALQKSMYDMHEDEEKFWKDKIGSMREEFQKRLEEKEQDLLEMEESVRQIRRDRARQLQSDQSDQELMQMEDNLGLAQGQLVQTRRLYEGFSQDPSGQQYPMGNTMFNPPSALVVGMAVGVTAASSGMCSLM